MPTDEGGLDAALASASARVRQVIETHLAGVTGEIGQAMLYASRGGKGLRGFLVLEGAALHGIETPLAAPAAAAVECIHAYSLVHDDMPVMDDDDLRRGRPTVHRKWDEATALLVGDALQALAFDLVGQGGDIPPDRRLALSVRLARAAGVFGMVEGQARDIAAEGADEPLSLDQITELQAKKTGALIEWAATAGPRLAGADPAPLAAYGRALGLAFQIADDLLDVTATEAELGKKTGKDADRGKATFVTHLGVEGARARAADLRDEAIAALEGYGECASLLRQAARFAIERRS